MARSNYVVEANHFLKLQITSLSGVRIMHDQLIWMRATVKIKIVFRTIGRILLFTIQILDTVQGS